MAASLRLAPAAHWNTGEEAHCAQPRHGRRGIRAAAVALAVLGQTFGGVLVSDGLAIYDALNPRQHKCYSHHWKAVSEALQTPQAPTDYRRQIQALLRKAMVLKALQEPVPAPRFTQCVNALKARAHALLGAPRAQGTEEKVRMRLWKQRDPLFPFLEYPQVPATHNLAHLNCVSDSVLPSGS